MRTYRLFAQATLALALLFPSTVNSQSIPRHEIPAQHRVLFEQQGNWRSNESADDAHISWPHTLKHQPNQVQTLVNRPDSVYFWSWDTTTVNWSTQAFMRGYYSLYDPQNNLLQSIAQSWNGSTWDNTEMDEFTYDTQNNTTSQTRKSWSGSSWTNAYRASYTYDLNNNQLSFLEEAWNGTAWDNLQQTLSTYDASNNLVTQETQNWNGTNWDNFSLDSSVYDANNNLVSQAHLTWSTQWDYNTLYLWTYNGSNQMTSSMRQTWNGVSWDYQDLYTYHYDINNLRDSSLYQNWNGTNWVDSRLTTYGYDAQDNQVMRLGQKFFGATIVNVSLENLGYDANHNIITDSILAWNGTAWYNYTTTATGYDVNNFYTWNAYRNYDNTGLVITDGDSLYIYSHLVVGIRDPGLSGKQLSVYPNPVHGGSFSLSYPPAKGKVQLQILNAMGQEVYTEEFDAQATKRIDVAELAAGVYTLRLTADGKSSSVLFLIDNGK